MKKGQFKPGHRGPRPAAYMEYGATTVFRGTVAKKAPGGNIRKFKVASVLGNGKGYAGIGFAQSADSGRVARSKSLTDAVKNMFYIERYQGRTVYHSIKTSLATTKVDIWPRREGSGVKAGRIASALMDRLGITDVGVKIRGSRNKTMQLKATVKALSMIEPHEDAAKRRGVMLPRLSYHDYRRVCKERNEEVAHGLLFAEDEPGANIPGMQVGRPRPSLPVLGMEALAKDPAMQARYDERKIAFFEARRKSLLTRLEKAHDRTDTPLFDRLAEEAAQLQQELWDEADAREALRNNQIAAWEQERAELVVQAGLLEPELMKRSKEELAAAGVGTDAQVARKKRQEESKERVFQMYKKRVLGSGGDDN